MRHTVEEASGGRQRFLGEKEAAGEAEGLAERLMGLTGMIHGKAGDDQATANVCIQGGSGPEAGWAKSLTLLKHL